MSILKKSGLLFLVLVLAGLAACDPESPAYAHIKNLPYSEWEFYAAKLPIEQRLDLQKEIMQRSGHNPQMTIEGAFAIQPDETYRALVRRIKNNDMSRYYLGVIYEINRSPNFKICDQTDRKVVQTYLLEIAGGPTKDRYQPDFYTC